MQVNEGAVVIVADTGQAGCVWWSTSETASVRLLNGDIWTGAVNLLRLPQSPEELAVAPIDVPRHESKRKRGSK